MNRRKKLDAPAAPAQAQNESSPGRITVSWLTLLLQKISVKRALVTGHLRSGNHNEHAFGESI